MTHFILVNQLRYLFWNVVFIYENIVSVGLGVNDKCSESHCNNQKESALVLQTYSGKSKKLLHNLDWTSRFLVKWTFLRRITKTL